MIWCIYFAVLIVVLKLYRVLTSSKCKYDTKLTGKVVIVTGSNSGIGFETAKDLARRGARVILACRDHTRGKNAQNQIIEATGNSDVEYKHLDLSSLASVRAFADNILSTEKRLDILVNNAAASFLNQKRTRDGFITEVQVNHLGPFLLTNLLLPAMKHSAPSRIINVSSIAYILGSTDFKKLDKKIYSDILVYCNTKLWNILFTRELSRRLEKSGVVANSMHPGTTRSNINRNANIIYKVLTSTFLAKTAWEGAQTSIQLAVAPECGEITGQFFMACKQQHLLWKATNSEKAKELWDISAKAVDLEGVNLEQCARPLHASPRAAPPPAAPRPPPPPPPRWVCWKMRGNKMPVFEL